MLSALFTVWAVATVILIALLIYRAVLGQHEDDQLYLSAGEQHMAKEQQVLVSKLQAIGKYSMILGTFSVLLLLVIAGLWTYQQLMRPPIS
jgi:hypothetical protein